MKNSTANATSVRRSTPNFDKQPKRSEVYSTLKGQGRGSRLSTPEALLIPELLEKIILHLLSFDRIITAPQVSRLWRKLVETSPSIRKRMIAEPYAFSQKCGGLPLYSERFTLSPALEQLSDMFARPTKTLWGTSNSEAPQHYRETFEKQLNRIRRQEASNSTNLDEADPCRHEFITDPRCSVVRLTIEKTSISPRGGVLWDTEADFMVRDPEGVKVGLLEDTAQAALTSAWKYSPVPIVGWTVEHDVYVDFLCPRP